MLAALMLAALVLALPACAQPASTPARSASARSASALAERAGFDVEAYAFRLALADTTNRLTGEAAVTVRFVADTARTVVLDLVGPPRRKGATGMRVTGVADEATGEAISFAHAADRLTMRLSAPPGSGAMRTLQIGYAGVPADGLVIGTNRHGDRTFFGDNWPERARHWLPTVDHPSDKATVAFDVTAPARYAVVANGRRVGRETLPDGRARTRWQTTAPLPTKVMVVGVAAFAVVPADTVAGVPVTSWVYPDDRAPGLADLAVTPRVLTFYAERLGAFPYAKLAGVQSTTRYGGMENASTVFYSERALADARRDDDLVAHEVAHQWFGDSVTEADWPHLWLSEGVATYLTTRFLAHAAPTAADGRARLRRRMARARQRVVRFARQAPTRPLVDTLARDPRTLLNANSYQKGAWVLHMLHARLGDAAFWDGLRTYHRRHRHGTATTADLRRAMEAASGDTLAAFVRQWTRRAGHPVLDVTWAAHADDAGAPGVRLTVRQTQRGAPFRFPLEVKAATAAGPVRLTLPVEAARKATFTRALPAMPTALTLDPRVRLLFEGTARRE